MHGERYALFSVAVVVVAHVKVTPCSRPALQMVISYRHKRRRHRRRRDQSQPRRVSQSHCRAVSSMCVWSDCISSPAAVVHPRECGRRGDSGRVYSVDPSASRRQSRGRSQADQTFLPQSSRSSLALPMPNLNTSIQFYPLCPFSPVEKNSLVVVAYYARCCSM